MSHKFYQLLVFVCLVSNGAIHNNQLPCRRRSEKLLQEAQPQLSPPVNTPTIFGGEAPTLQRLRM